MMNKQWIIFFFCLSGTVAVHAQWTPEDSLWLKNVLSGKDSLRLNPETIQAIREGRFLRLDRPKTPLQPAQPQLPIQKDFSEYIGIAGDSLSGRKVPLKDLPPQVFWQWNPQMPQPKYQLSDRFFDFMKSVREEGVSPSGHSFADLIEYAFNPQFRQISKNRKHAVKQRKIREEQSRLDIPAIRSDARKSPELPLPLVILRKKDSLATNQSSAEPDSISGEVPADSLEYKMHRP
jgi:hypothetical protein